MFMGSGTYTYRIIQNRFGFTNVYPAGWQQGGVLRPANSTYNYGSQTTHKAGLYYPSGEQMEIPNYKPYEEK